MNILKEMERSIKTADEIISYLNEHECDFADVSEWNGEIEITIDWGDWKHSHIRTDYFMKLAGFEKTGEEETESDGSDCYSSIHYYQKK